MEKLTVLQRQWPSGRIAEGLCHSTLLPTLPAPLSGQPAPLAAFVAMSRTGWNLLSPRYTLTKIPSTLLSNYYCNGYPLSPKMEDRPYKQYGQCLYTEDRWDQLCAWLTGNPTFRRQLAGYKQALRDQMGYSQEDSDPRNKARRTVPPPGEGSSSSAAGSSCHIRPPPPPPPYGWSPHTVTAS